MSSRDSSYSYASEVIHQEFRSPKSGDYKVDTTHRNGSKSVSVYNHHSTTYDTTAPHPGYGKPAGSDREPSRTSSRT
ncbi:hypothetical protein F5Y02DRAFT_419441 [Annulohypoxylon stygium]|nr:hypothetical protein F5Y02DRAFT_419441 [Annulohypoxylon stygium]